MRQKIDFKVNEPSGEVVIDTLVKDKETQLVDEHKILDENLVAGLVGKSNRILASVTSIFPFDLFPNTVNVEEGRITVIVRNFFLSSQVHSVDIKDISNVFINLAPFFAQLVVVSKTFARNQIKIKFLKKDEAIFARRMIEGLRVFESKQIDTSIYSREELIAKLKELSTTEIVM
ncbi:MAG: hypothetical protein US68_C0012G0022 [Candidatus Shapirobacteria bacterium GW2011_GWE1_38_10]|uniref:Uncharacterized protein n=1 Tax=Candidatus Shapirobacteria bacterium GW2011_GWE1_38_10 TaxID=1618488 RepID=A0A0G0I525_9BACT|nr:MAG: hypothetical protein US46_C0011G0028 [Candidatus Shapirobacteria bacterium GW2011_GWF2_37_20]KKQ49627.1 MAG: hypothetical protein US68_C0012G0022 [Candidatus Shapirobacteria bacterium GW2011_GWE1_38_10]KKQ64605.1 MAG: hypothetical protein US85_C0006G0012 [Candidatus Shapirobacteria bacterium GW2011_GWF1_38_23]